MKTMWFVKEVKVDFQSNSTCFVSPILAYQGAYNFIMQIKL